MVLTPCFVRFQFTMTTEVLLLCFLFYFFLTSKKKKDTHKYSYYLKYSSVFEPASLNKVNENTRFAHVGDNDLFICHPFDVILCILFIIFIYLFQR